MKTLTLCFCILFLAGCAGVEEEAESTPVVQVKVTRADVEDVAVNVQAPATIYPREQASIASKIVAPIWTLPVKKGDMVAAGQVIARLNNRDLVAQRTEAIDRARADAAAAEATLAQAQKNLERRQKLFDQGAIPARDLLATQTEAAQAKASFDVSKKYLDRLQGTGEQASSDTSKSDGETDIAYLNTQIEFSEIRSPFAGVVTEQFMYPGDMAKPELPIFTVMDLSVAVARAQVPTDQIADVARGQACAFESVDAPGKKSTGRVSVVSQAVDPARRTVEVWCEIPNANRSLRAGLFGSLTVSVGTARRAIVVPESAVQFTQGSTKGMALVVDEKNVAHEREVEAVSVPGGKVRVVKGIEGGETVVTEGGYGLPDGTEVAYAEAAK
jgi:HlyD family secretion protein